jgi:hypothetical protein
MLAIEHKQKTHHSKACQKRAECVFACFYLLDGNLYGIFKLLILLFNNFSWTLESRNCSPEIQHIFSYFQLLILVAGACFPKPTPTSRCKLCAESIQWTTTQMWHRPVFIPLMLVTMHLQYSCRLESSSCSNRSTMGQDKWHMLNYISHG